jgi:hypothetical protein
MLFQMVYVSTAVRPFRDAELTELLFKSRKRNEERGVTGMLLYKGNEFMQAIEGEESVIADLAERISRDPRHRDVRVILNAAAKNREFPDWTMGFHNLNDPGARRIEGYTSFLDSPLRSPVLTDNPSLCRDFLMLFKTKPDRVPVFRR